MPTAKIVTYRYIVRGRGLFPFDMCRYDRAWPASEHDAGLVESTTRRVSEGTIDIAMRGLSVPTTGRWSSFGWEVPPTSVKKES